MSSENRLGVFGAITHALFNRSASHFPAFPNQAGAYVRVREPDIVQEILKELNKLAKPKDGDLKTCLDRGRETLNEVKGLTEYQDQKATRLLTIVTFLSALSGALFSRFADSYPIQEFMRAPGFCAAELLVYLTYFFFALFAFSAACGALVVFHATRTRFKYPSSEPAATDEQEPYSGSYLFYSDIIELRPRTWARAFTTSPAGEGTTAPNEDLSMQYFKNYIVESYLVAAKVADKLRYLHPAQDILSFAVRMLVVWIALVAATTLSVPVFHHVP